MGHSRMVRASDVVRILRFRDELDEMTESLDARMHHVLNSTCRMLGAQVGAVAFAEQFLPGQKSQPRYLRAWEGGWMGAAERAEYYRYLAGDHCADACVRPLASIRSKLFTRYREQLVPDSDWYSLDNVNLSRRVARVDAVIYSVYRTDDQGGCLVFGLHRPWGERRPFAERERTLLHLLHRAIVPKLVPLATLMLSSALTPRLNDTLRLLLEGLPEKQVASRLGVTRNTAHGYVKEIYRRLNVESRPELMAKFAATKFGH